MPIDKLTIFLASIFVRKQELLHKHSYTLLIKVQLPEGRSVKMHQNSLLEINLKEIIDNLGKVKTIRMLITILFIITIYNV